MLVYTPGNQYIYMNYNQHYNVAFNAAVCMSTPGFQKLLNVPGTTITNPKYIKLSFQQIK